MEAKLFEVRDKGTFMPVLAVLLSPGPCATREEFTGEMFLLGRCGMPAEKQCVGIPPSNRYVLMTPIYSHPEKATTDPYDWGDRTRHTAHLHIIEAWHALRSGDVIDVEYLLGETQTKKVSEKGQAL